MWQSVLGQVFPAHCLACGQLLPYPLTTCCETCLPGLYEGGYQILSGDPGPRLKVISLFPYEHTGRALIRAIKFRGQRRLLARLAEPLARVARDFDLPCPGARFCPVPTTAARRRERGGNPSEWLARELALRTGGQMVEALERVRRGRDQKSLDRAGRLSNLDGHFRIQARRAPGLAGGQTWLVDDVVTTGATLEQCALALIRAGHPPAGAVVLARTPLEGEWVSAPDRPVPSAGDGVPGAFGNS